MWTIQFDFMLFVYTLESRPAVVSVAPFLLASSAQCYNFASDLESSVWLTPTESDHQPIIYLY